MLAYNLLLNNVDVKSYLLTNSFHLACHIHQIYSFMNGNESKKLGE